MSLEFDLLREYWLFCRRHIRYAPIFLAVYGYSAPRWKKTRPLRAAYALTQAVDDLLDGDRPCAQEPENEVRALLAGRATGGLARIAAFVLPHIQSCGAEEDFFKLVDCMILDRRRVRDGIRLTEAGLASHHRTVFECSANVALQICGFELRASDVPGVIEELSWVSPMRDLREDLHAGLNNLPLEVCPENLSADEALTNPCVRRWLAGEYQKMLKTIPRTGAELERVRGKTGAFGFRIFHRLLSDYAKKYPRRYPEVFQ